MHKIVPRNFIIEQKAAHENICIETENISNFLEKVVTCDESWAFTYDPEIKPQSMQWKNPTSLRVNTFNTRTVTVVREAVFKLGQRGHHGGHHLTIDSGQRNTQNRIYFITDFPQQKSFT